MPFGLSFPDFIMAVVAPRLQNQIEGVKAERMAPSVQRVQETGFPEYEKQYGSGQALALYNYLYPGAGMPAQRTSQMEGPQPQGKEGPGAPQIRTERVWPELTGKQRMAGAIGKMPQEEIEQAAGVQLGTRLTADQQAIEARSVRTQGITFVRDVAKTTEKMLERGVPAGTAAMVSVALHSGNLTPELMAQFPHLQDIFEDYNFKEARNKKKISEQRQYLEGSRYSTMSEEQRKLVDMGITYKMFDPVSMTGDMVRPYGYITATKPQRPEQSHVFDPSTGLTTTTESRSVYSPAAGGWTQTQGAPYISKGPAPEKELDPGAVNAMLDYAEAGGGIPNLGLMGTGTRNSFWKGLNQRVKEKGISYGTLMTRAATRQSAGAELTALMRQQGIREMFESKANKTLDYLMTLWRDVPKVSDIAVASRTIDLYLRGELGGDPQIRQFLAVTEPAAQEVAKVISGQVTGAGLVEGQRKVWEKLLDPALSARGGEAVIKALKQDMKFAIDSGKEEISNVQNVIGNIDKIGAKGPSTPGAPDRYGYRIGETMKVGTDTYEYIGDNKWQKR